MGSCLTGLDGQYAQELGLVQSRAWNRVYNITGETSVARLDSLSVGDNTFEKFPVLVISLAHVTQPLGTRLDGILGMNLLGVTGCTIDTKQGRLSLPSSGGRGHPVPIALDHDGVWIDALISGRQIRMSVDTGSNWTELEPAEFASVATTSTVSTSSIQVGDVNRIVTNRVVRELPAECKVGDAISTPIVIQEGSMNRLGMDFLRHWIVTFDVKNGLAYFEDYVASKAQEATVLPGRQD
jgi:hypothetical protein